MSLRQTKGDVLAIFPSTMREYQPGMVYFGSQLRKYQSFCQAKLMAV